MIQVRQIRGERGRFVDTVEEDVPLKDKDRCGGCGTNQTPFYPLGESQFCGYCFQRRSKNISPKGLDPEKKPVHWELEVLK